MSMPKPRKPRERPKGIFLGMSSKTNPSVIIYPPDQIPKAERERLAQAVVNVLRQRDSEPDGSGYKAIGQAG